MENQHPHIEAFDKMVSETLTKIGNTPHEEWEKVIQHVLEFGIECYRMGKGDREDEQS